MHWFLPSRAANGHRNAAHCTENLFIQTFCLHGGLQSVASLYTWRLTAVDWTDGFVRQPGSTSEQRRHLNFSHWILDESVRRLIKVASQSCVTLGRLAPFYICSRFVKKSPGKILQRWWQSSSLFRDEHQRGAAPVKAVLSLWQQSLNSLTFGQTWNSNPKGRKN